MTESVSPFLAVGSPTFQNPAISRKANDEGMLAAWRELLSENAEKALASVGGDFAVALELPDGSMLLAVDRFAIRTLCWRLDDGRLRFSLRADDFQPEGAKIEPQALFDYLNLHSIASPVTVFKGVFRIPPAHYAVFREGRITVGPYWVPHFRKPARQPNLEALTKEFRSLLKQAVADQLDGSQPACFLSGGTDSSTIAGMIREATGKPAVAYSIGFEAEGYDEMTFARTAAQHFGAEHHEYYVTPDDLVRSMPALAAACDQPFGNSSMLPAYYCALQAKKNGATRMLAGDGGDELFGGNLRYSKQNLFDAYSRVPAALRRGLIEPVVSLAAVKSLPGLRKVASYVEQAKEPMPDRMQIYNLLLRLGLQNVLEPALLAAVDVNASLRQQQRVWAAAQADDPINRTLAFDWRYTLAEADLTKVRTATQYAGVAVGFPMLDQRLLEFSLTLPMKHKVRGQQLRWFFKEALRGFLPEEIINKRKQGFGLPYGVWLTRHTALKQQAEDALFTLSKRGVIRPQFIDSLVREKLPEHPGYFGEMIWILSVLEFWFRGHAPDFHITN